MQQEVYDLSGGHQLPYVESGLPQLFFADKARDELRQGTDPIEARDARKEAERQADEARRADKARERRTLARCSRDYHERVIERTRKSKHAAQWLASLENHVPPGLWNAPIDSITAPALLQALQALKPHERARNLKDGHHLAETVRRIRQRLESVFEDAQFHGWSSSNPAAAIRRKMREAMPAKQAGQFAALPFKEAPALTQRLRDAEGNAARCLEMALLTAARTGEARRVAGRLSLRFPPALRDWPFRGRAEPVRLQRQVARLGTRGLPFRRTIFPTITRPCNPAVRYASALSGSTTPLTTTLWLAWRLLATRRTLI